MAGHGVNQIDPHESSATATRNSRIGMRLFVVYLLLYGTFVLTNAFAPDMMERVVFSGMNLAIVFGFLLIITAFLLAILYGWMCRHGVHDRQAG